MQDLIGFVLAALALAGSPGPGTLSLAATGAAFGAMRGLPYMIGIDCGMVLVMAITSSGAVGLVLAVPGTAPVIGGLAAAYFAYLAYRIGTAPPLGEDTGTRRHPRFAEGVLLSLINPKAYAAMAALFSGFVLLRDAVALDVVLKIAILSVLIVAINLTWLVVGSALTSLLRAPRTNRAINVVFAVLLLISVVFALLL